MKVKAALKLVAHVALGLYVFWALTQMVQGVNTVTDRRYLDCVVISGDEMICKQVNAIDPGYVPIPGSGGQGVTTHK